MSPVFSTKDFEGCFFNIGAGLDLQPLMRYSHLCTDFVFTNLFVEMNKVQNFYEAMLIESKNLELVDCKVINNFCEEEFFELSTSWRADLLAGAFMTAQERQTYIQVFEEARAQPPWALIYIIKRRHLNRTLRLIYFTSEGLAAYITLSKNGNIAPKVLCTIQTGVLEYPQSMLFRYLITCEKLPSEWIRGFQPSPLHIGEMYHDALRCCEPFNHHGKTSCLAGKLETITILELRRQSIDIVKVFCIKSRKWLQVFMIMLAAISFILGNYGVR